MANGYIIGSGGGSSLEQTGNDGIPIYVNSDDELQACTYISLHLHGVADKAKQLCSDDAGTLYNVGENGDTIISFTNGIPVASTTTIGSNSTPIYLNKGKLTALDATIGSTSKPVYLNKGTITQCNDTLANNISGTAATATKLQINTTSANTIYYILGAAGQSAGVKDVYNAYNVNGIKNKTGIRFNAQTGVLMGAAWNDYAEFRQCDEEPGTCVVESETGKLIRATKRLQKCPYVVSDTYGFIIGPDSPDYKAVAVSGRVLAKTLEQLCIGDVVCSGPNGTVSKMNKLEVILFPDRILGIVSEIPSYTEWNNIEVNNRVWVKVR